MEKKFIALFLAILVAVCSVSVNAAEDEDAPQVFAKGAVLYDVTSGKILYEKNSESRMYPASMTKILTAIVFMDYFKPDEYIVCGDEVYQVPAGSSLSGNKPGETLLVENALRLLIIPSGNETADVVAVATAKRATENNSLTFSQAEQWFAEAMNKKAAELGAKDTHFVNAHGFHDARHYTTPYDMAIISAAAMQNPLIRQIAGETAFVGNGAGSNPPAGAFTQEYHWETHNDLIKPGSPFYYPGAFGIKTGFHDEAGNCLSAAAEKDGRELIAITMFDETVEQRWTDATVLFNYGFNNFSYVDVQAGDIVLGEIPLSNYRLGADSSIEYKAVGKFSALLSSTQAERISREVTFLPELLAPPETDEKTGITDNTTRLKTPVSMGQVIGYADYILDGELLFHAEVISMGDALERTFNSDMEYHIEVWKARALSPYAVPVYTGIVILLYIIIRLAVSARQKKRNSGFYRGRGRRF